MTNIEKIRENLRSILGWRELRDAKNIPIERIEDLAREALRLFDQEVGRDAVAWSLAWPEEAKHGGVNAMTTFSSKQRAEDYAASCFNGEPIKVVPLYTYPLARDKEWIRVEDRMPMPNQDVLYYFEITGISIGKYLGENGGNVFGGRLGWLTDDVTHWMPLPAKPLARGAEPNTKEQGE